MNNYIVGKHAIMHFHMWIIYWLTGHIRRHVHIALSSQQPFQCPKHPNFKGPISHQYCPDSESWCPIKRVTWILGSLFNDICMQLSLFSTNSFTLLGNPIGTLSHLRIIRIGPWGLFFWFQSRAIAAFFKALTGRHDGTRIMNINMNCHNPLWNLALFSDNISCQSLISL